MKIEDILSGGYKRHIHRGPRRGRIRGIELAPIKLKEGGNVFDDVVPFNHEKIPEITNAVNSVLDKAGARAIPIGSGATPTPGKVSGDLDMIVDQDQLAKSLGVGKPAEIRKALRALYDNAGFETGQSGVSVHVRVEAGDEAHQVDLMIVPNAENAARFHTHNIPKGSRYKGVHKHIALAKLAKMQNMLWSPYQGLFSRDDKGKKADLVSDDPDQIAGFLLGQGATAKDIGSFEAILDRLGKKGDDLLAALQDDPSWKEPE